VRDTAPESEESALLNPVSDPDGLVAEAHRQLTLGDLAAAELACRQALATDARHVAATTLLGATLLTQRRFGEAEAVYTDLAERAPEHAAHWVNLGSARRGLGQLDKALAAYGYALKLGASTADLYFNIGLTHLDRADFEAARSILDQARALAPQDAEVRMQYAHACYRCLRNEEAAAALMDWRSLDPTSAAVLAQIAQLLVNLGMPEEGNAALDLALADPGVDATTLLAAIETLERINRLPEAQALMIRLEATPQSSTVDEHLVIVRARIAARLGDHASAELFYRQALLTNSDSAQKHMELFPLAQSLDALGRYEEAWATLREAHASQLEYLQRVAPLLVLSGAPPMLITRHSCHPADVAAWGTEGPSVADSPVFVVGFPRSGTTLLEMTLDAHPDLQSMDETSFIQDALDEIHDLTPDYPHGLAGLTHAQLAELRAGYWRRVATKVRLRSGARLVDKNPLNILRLPVLRRLFPNAPILLGIRHPCDVLLSCYMQHFRSPDFAILCHRLPILAHAYRRTFDFWYEQAAILKPHTHEVSYETLVADFAAEVRRILDFLQLPWHDAVLRPGDRAQAKGFISTPSYTQVVRPVSSASVGRWHRYEQQLAPAIDMVKPQLERWNYAAVVAVEGVSPNSR